MQKLSPELAGIFRSCQTCTNTCDCYDHVCGKKQQECSRSLPIQEGGSQGLPPYLPSSWSSEMSTWSLIPLASVPPRYSTLRSALRFYFRPALHCFCEYLLIPTYCAMHQITVFFHFFQRKLSYKIQPSCHQILSMEDSLGKKLPLARESPLLPSLLLIFKILVSFKESSVQSNQY